MVDAPDGSGGRTFGATAAGRPDPPIPGRDGVRQHGAGHVPDAGHGPDVAQATRIFLRPIANPFALGFLGLAAATIMLAGLELQWIPSSESIQVAVIVLVTAPTLQLVACVFGFLGRDAVAATGMGVLAVTWAVIGADHLLTPPDATSRALATLLFLSATAMALSAITASETKVLPAVVMGTTALRFLVTALYEVFGSPTVRIASGAIGCLLAVLAVYAAFALELEGLQHRTVLPTLRRGRGRQALEPELAPQVQTVAAEPGVRNQL